MLMVMSHETAHRERNKHSPDGEQYSQLVIDIFRRAMPGHRSEDGRDIQEGATLLVG